MVRCRALAVIAAACLAAAACGSSSSSSGSSASSGSSPFVVGYTPLNNLVNQYQVAWKNQLQQGVQAAGGTLKVCLPGTSATQQANCVQQFISSKVNAIVIYAIDAQAMIGPIKAANKAHIPVVGFVSEFPSAGEQVAFSVNVDDAGAGALAGHALVQALTQKYGSPKGTVLEIQGLLTTSAAQLRGSGFHQVVNQYPNIKVVSKPANWDTSMATTIIQDWMSAHPDTDAMYFQSEGGYLPAAEAVLKKLHRWVPAGQPGHVILVGEDGTNIGLNAVKCGYMEEDGDYALGDFTPLAAKLIIQMLKTGSIPKAGQVIPDPGTMWKQATVLSNASVAGPIVNIPATAITKSNASDPRLFGNKFQGAPNGLSAC
jgi:simple sugar transport system substrate-binding protein